MQTRKASVPKEPDFKGLSRRQLRYWCFRYRTEAEGGAPSTGAPRGLREHYESQGAFRGWPEFGGAWDVDQKDPFLAVLRQFTVWEEWDATLRRVAVPFPGPTGNFVDKAKKANGGEGNVGLRK